MKRSRGREREREREGMENNCCVGNSALQFIIISVRWRCRAVYVEADLCNHSTNSTSRMLITAEVIRASFELCEQVPKNLQSVHWH